ncbi:outer membrane protein transport protein [Bacteroides acidifaciens]|uniref:outer membrane protein transport protein n=1 Tax=Bacteroides acidifaciens TaxID=85831 RepID=UPI00158A6116|nr:outer membrane protein transport protein [Bacteroides acidifaciens]
MVGFKHTLCALLLTMVTGVAIAQNNTNSPYTRYGYGDLSDQSFGNSKAMGGIAFGLRDGAQINPLNPASYTAIDSLTFIFEGGVSLQNMNISDGVDKLNAKNSSFDYLAMQFRLHPRVAMSIGLLPFSNVGYSVSKDHPATPETQPGANDATPDYTSAFTGDGGLHQLYVGAGVKVLKNLSLGVNVSYFWGDITRSLTMLYPNTASANSFIRQTAVSISDYKLDFGAQYTQDLSKKHSVTIGAVYSLKHKLNNDYTVTRQASATSSDNLDATLELPNIFGVGFTYNYDKRLTVGMDYSLQQWSKAKFGVATTDDAMRDDFDETYAYCDRHKISVGAEYIPNLIGRSYLSHIKYRLGAYYTTPYYKIDGKKASREYGVTAGFGLPVPRSRSILSISGQFVRVSGQEATFVNENIFRVSIGLTFNERWFFKRRVE